MTSHSYNQLDFWLHTSKRSTWEYASHHTKRNQKKNCWVLLKQLLHLITDSYGSNLRFQSQWNTHSQVSDHLRILKISPPFWDVSLKTTCHQLRPEKLPRCTKRPPPCRKRYRRQLWRKLSMNSLEWGRHFGWEIPAVSSSCFLQKNVMNFYWNGIKCHCAMKMGSVPPMKQQHCS